jgi:Esterase/lipase
MEKYSLTNKMSNIIKLSQRFTETDVDKLTPELIHSINQRTIPNNRLTRKLFNKPIKDIVESTYVIPVENGAVTGYLYSDFRLLAASGLTPLIIFYHGGGWIWGNMDLYAFFCQRLAQITKSCVLSVDYRLAPQYKFPTAVEDCYDAFLWASKGVKYWKIDPDRIFVAGDSVGANLAATVALLARERKGPKINGQILIYPITDCRLRTNSVETYYDSPTLTERQLQFYIKSYQREPKDILSPYFSPLLAQDLSRMPDSVIITAQFDPLKDDGALYAEALNEAGSKSKNFEIPNSVHGFINYPHADGYETAECIIRQFVGGRAVDKIQAMTEKELKKYNAELKKQQAQTKNKEKE